MKYYVFEAAEGDSKIAGVAVGTFETLNDAVASFHGRLSTAMKSELFTSDLVLVIDSYGMPIKTEKFVREIPKPEPEVATPTETGDETTSE